jgi:hypothetical protein
MSEKEQIKTENKQPQPRITKKPSKVAELVSFAKSATEYKEINFGTIANFQAQQINSVCQVFVRGATMVLDTDGIRHAITGHGNHKLESERGQVGIQDSDFELIPEILKNPDSYEKSNNTNRMRTCSVIFLKKTNGKIYHVVMNIMKSNFGYRLVFKTMYIRK